MNFKGESDMKIIKTSQQVKEEVAKKVAAFNEMNACPECGCKPKRIHIQMGMRSGGMFYRAHCRFCGCEWESEEF